MNTQKDPRPGFPGRRTLIFCFFLILWLVACSVEITSVTPPPAATPTAGSASGLPTPPFATPSAVPASPWGPLQLSGRLLFMTYNDNGDTELAALDMASGVQTTLFQPPSRGWLAGFAVSPDGRQIALAYAPPTAQGGSQLGYSSLFTIPADGSGEPKLVMSNKGSDEAFFTPAWSPDGRYLYYAHYTRVEAEDALPFKYDLERIVYPDGRPELLIENALWPDLSPDGSRLAYLNFDPITFANDLYLADADGQNPTLVVAAGTFVAVDAHFFSPDGQMLLFSAVSDPSQQPQSWLDKLMGVKIASAHNVPSDWWRVSVQGGQPQQLTNILDTGLYGDFSPDGQYVAFTGASGLSVMNPDGTGLTRLRDLLAFGGLQWTSYP